MGEEKLKILTYELLERWYNCESTLNQDWVTFENPNIQDETDEDYEDYKRRIFLALKHKS